METTFIDQFSDPSFRHLNWLRQRYPEAVGMAKTAKLDSEENEKRASTAFAWIERRLFPIDEPEQAVVSRIYMEKQAGIPKEVIDRCDKALEMYGIKLNLVEKVAEAPPTDDFLLPEIRRYRVKTADDVKLASEAIIRNQKVMDIGARAEASKNLVKKAVEHEVKLPTQILKFAGATMCDTKRLRDWLGARAEATADPQIKAGYEELYEKVSQFPAFIGDREELIKVACAIQELDEAADLGRFYDRMLLDPLSTVFNTEKVADEMIELAGRQVTLEQLLQVEPDVYRDVFGPDLADEFIDGDMIDPEQLKVILPTVPFDLQRTLAVQMGV